MKTCIAGLAKENCTIARHILFFTTKTHVVTDITSIFSFVFCFSLSSFPPPFFVVGVQILKYMICILFH